MADDLVASLRQHGMRSPLRSLRDPRIEYPELLLTSGWERYETPDGYAYRYTAEEDPAAHRSWEQIYKVNEDGTVMLVTRAGEREQTLQAGPDGQLSNRERTLSCN